jgi:TRAP-type C4-dicarboxylate transport system substrate-binding protein
MKVETDMNKFFAILSLAALALLGSVSTTAGAATRIKLGTLAPVGTSYYKTLMAMGETWRKDSAGSVELIVYAGGKMGGEAEMVGLMKADSLQAAMLTAVGLAEIEHAVTGLQNIPMGFRDFGEVDYVGQKLQPMLEARMEKKGFVVLFWSDAGWVRFFSNKPVTHPDDLKKLRLFTWAGNPEEVEIYKSAGFNPVPRETADIVTGLETGLIDAVPVPPFFAISTQIYSRASHMLELNWGPLVGALVVRKQTWDKLSTETRAALLKTAVNAGKEIKANGRKESDESVAAMSKRGLKVTKISPEVEAEWRRAAEAVYPKIRGTLVPADVFDQTLKFLEEYRATQKK